MTNERGGVRDHAYEVCLRFEEGPLRPRPNLEWLEALVHRLTEQLPRPSLVAIGNTKVYRFEKSIHAAIVLKTPNQNAPAFPRGRLYIY